MGAFDFNFGFDEFRESVLDLCHKGFDFWRRQNAGQKFYAFGILTAPRGSSPVPICSTEEALAEVAQRYVDSGYKPDLESATYDLRWEPGDWLGIGEVAEYLRNHAVYQFNDEINRILDPLDIVENESDDAKFSEFMFKLDEVYYQVLQQLDEEGRFGTGDHRNGVIVNLLMYDQSNEERVSRAEKLNPPKAFAPYKEHLIPRRLEELANMYKQFGATDARDRAWDHFYHGESVLAETILVRQAWRKLLRPDDHEWIDEALSVADEPRAGDYELGTRLRRILDKGVDREDLTAVVREMQWDTMFQVLCLFEWTEIEEEELKHIRWHIFQVDDDDQPIERLKPPTSCRLSAMDPARSPSTPTPEPPPRPHRRF